MLLGLPPSTPLLTDLLFSGYWLYCLSMAKERREVEGNGGSGGWWKGGDALLPHTFIISVQKRKEKRSLFQNLNTKS